jgi:hypothetical protein
MREQAFLLLCDCAFPHKNGYGKVKIPGLKIMAHFRDARSPLAPKKNDRSRGTNDR